MENITPSKYSITREHREARYKQKACLLWFTGLSGSGKSTLANEVLSWLFDSNYHVYGLDGDNLRAGLNCDLKFNRGDREENIRRVGEVSKLFVDAGLIVTAAFISPYRISRNVIRYKLKDPADFIEIYVKCPIEVCEKRDVKGLYKMARDGLIHDFTGVSGHYEVPESPNIVVDTEKLTIEECRQRIISYLILEGYLLLGS